MTTTRTQQKLLDKEIDCNRKDENDSKVTIIKKWGDPDRFLDQYFNNREKWDNLNQYNLLYVLQNKEYKKQYRENNNEKITEYMRQYRARKKLQNLDTDLLPH